MKLNPWPYVEKEELAAAERVLRSGKLNQWTGNEVSSFQDEYADYLDVSHTIALANGTLALELGLRALGIGLGDEVIVTCRSFVASASAIIMCNAIPVFADIDPKSQNITVETIKNVVTTKTKAILAVHLAGWPCDLPKLKSYCDDNDFFLIEDCAQAHGAKIENQAVGSFGDVAAFSFCQDKIITTGGEGGLFATNNSEIWKKAWSFKDHGRDYDMTFQTLAENLGFRWMTKTVGTNWRMTEMQAAMGRESLKKLDTQVKKRREIAQKYNNAFAKFKSLRVPQTPANIYHSFYKYDLFLNLSELKTGWDRDRISDEINGKGILCRVGSCPEIYNEEIFAEVAYPDGRVLNTQPEKPLKNASKIANESLMLQCHPTLTNEQVDYVTSSVSDIISTAEA